MGKKTIYSKPSVQFVEIITNDLCAGSVCTTVDLSSIKLQEMKRHSSTYTLKNGNSKDMWNSKF